MYDATLFSWTLKKKYTLSFSVIFTYFNLGSFDWALLKKSFLSDFFQITSLKLSTLPDCFVASSRLVTVFRRTDITRILNLSIKPDLVALKHRFFIAKLSLGKVNYESFKVTDIVSKYNVLVQIKPFFSFFSSKFYFFFFFRYLKYTFLARIFMSFSNCWLTHNYLIYL